MASHLLGFKYLLGLLLLPPSPSAAPISLEQCGGREGVRYCPRTGRGSGVLCWDLLAQTQLWVLFTP